MVERPGHLLRVIPDHLAEALSDELDRALVDLGQGEDGLYGIGEA